MVRTEVSNTPFRDPQKRFVTGNECDTL